MDKLLEDRVAELERQAAEWKKKERNLILTMRDDRLETLEAKVRSLQRQKWLDFAVGFLGYAIATIIAHLIF